MKNALFNLVRSKRPGTNLFDLSHEKKLSMNMGELVPILLQEIVPGDKFYGSSELLIRLAPMLAPVMHRINAYVHYFFVPSRILWEDWEKFITGGVTGVETTVFPVIGMTEARKQLWVNGSLADYMGAPTINDGNIITQPLDISALPFRAYQLIYNEYYRDQTLSAISRITKDSVLTEDELYECCRIRTRSWEKDYFTSALPFSQRGSEVMLPIDLVQSDVPAEIRSTPGGGTPTDGPLTVEGGKLTAGVTYASLNQEGAGEVSINELRRATRLQEWLEKNARGGARLKEMIYSHFGVNTSDARLQRPEYLGGGKTPVVVSEVLSTFNNDTVDGGTMYGHGLSIGKTNSFKRRFEEHGYLLGIMSVLPATAYSQGVDKTLAKFDKFQYYWPEFAHLGEQEIYNAELYMDWTGASAKNGIFGYTPRYAEYKFAKDTVHGDFKDTLSYWHMGRIFGSAPALNETFIKANPTTRPWPVTNTSHKLYVNIYNNVKAIRPMPVFGTPSL